MRNRNILKPSTAPHFRRRVLGGVVELSTGLGAVVAGCSEIVVASRKGGAAVNNCRLRLSVGIHGCS